MCYGNEHRIICFCEPNEIDELPYEDDMILNAGDINHIFIESMTSSQTAMKIIPHNISKVVN